jgi:hypothetical protein
LKEVSLKGNNCEILLMAAPPQNVASRIYLTVVGSMKKILRYRRIIGKITFNIFSFLKQVIE